MKEYEYIVKNVEGYLCDQLTGVICSENYRLQSYDMGYMLIFKEYWSLHKNYVDNQARFQDPALKDEVDQELEDHCQKQRKEILERFLRDMQACAGDSGVDLAKYKDHYLEELGKEDTKTLAKRVCLYPYIVSVMREYHEEERKKSDGLEV